MEEGPVYAVCRVSTGMIFHAEKTERLFAFHENKWLVSANRWSEWNSFREQSDCNCLATNFFGHAAYKHETRGLSKNAFGMHPFFDQSEYDMIWLSLCKN
jgi:hypothetical protein